MINRSIQHLLIEAENEESVSSLCKLLMLIGQEMDSRLIKTAISSSQVPAQLLFVSILFINQKIVFSILKNNNNTAPTGDG
jgi:hypothetical protein